MLQAYIDDSASDLRADKRLLLAGYIQSAEAWAKLSEEWADELAKAPRLDSLHMATCFEGWSEPAREIKINALVAVLKRYQPLSIECSISRADYVRVLRPYAPYDLRHPYFACFVGILYGVARTVAEERLSGPVDLVFDMQGNVGADAALWYIPLKHMDPALMRVLGDAPRFENDDCVLPLQAADMLAWYVRRCAETVCSARQREVADAIRFRHRYMEIPVHLIAEWARAFETVPGIEKTIGRRGSTNKFMRRIVGSLPPDKVVPTLNAIASRAKRMRWLMRALTWFSHWRVWKRITHRRFKIRRRP